jgi:hypothetical protein
MSYEDENAHVDEVAASLFSSIDGTEENEMLSGRIPSPGPDATPDEVDLWGEKIDLGYEAWRDECMDDSVDAWD